MNKWLLLTLITVSILTVRAHSGPSRSQVDFSGLPFQLFSTRYIQNYRTPSQSIFNYENGFMTKVAQQEMILNSGPATCATILGHQRKFSLRKQVQRGHMSAEQEDFLSRAYLDLHPSQIQFFELVSTVPVNELQRRHPNLDESDINVSGAIIEDGNINLTRASLWSVAGQISRPGVKLDFVKMPWQKDFEFQHVTLDRQKYPFAVEWGSAGQIEANMIGHLVQAATLSALLEAQTLGTPPQDVTIFVHALDRVHVSLYTKSWGFTEFARSASSPYNQVLTTTLGELLSRFPPSEFLTPLNRLKVATNGALTELQALGILDAFASALRQEFDYVSDRFAPSGPVIVRHLGFYAGFFAAAKAAQAGVFEKYGPEIHNILRTTQFFESTPDREKIVDGVSLNARFQQPLKGIVISNLDPTAVKKIPNFIALHLLATLHQYELAIESHNLNVYKGEMIEKTTYHIATSSPQIIEATRKLGPSSTQSFQWHETAVHIHTGVGNPIEKINIQGKDALGLTFTFSQLDQLRKQNPRLWRQAKSFYRKGYDDRVRRLSLGPSPL